ncbi:related to YER185w, Rta1p [Cephalotrichum gorgonifer]|uniref:Related to YER185w, Rta1p n=1 Tax=Cephalotrichum gorgonifer TaxID=2041049 RepID=A0AAE8SUI6_9PEZI|nr:related to YER185w, Rta1p [Cephalotrichum gorgonifer]
MDFGKYAKGDLLVGCQELIPGLANAYGYVPSLGAGIAFSVLFALTGGGHLFRSIQHRRWTSYLLTISSAIELVGWIGRTWSSKCPYNKIAFLLQITTLVVAPVFIAAGIYVTLGYLITEVGPRYSVLRPRTYLWSFCIADAVSLLIQSGGAGLASAATNNGKDPEPGARMMVGGIIFQLACVTLFTVLFVIFIWRTRRVDMSRGQNLVVWATCVSVTAVFIRCVFRAVELLQGWEGYLMKTEGFFIGLDAVCMVIAIGVYNIIDPSVLLTGGKPDSSDITADVSQYGMARVDDKRAQH